MKKGKIIPNGVILEKHEYKTILFFTEMGTDVELILRSNKEGIIDLRRAKRHQFKCIREIEKEFKKSKSLSRLIVILKNGSLLTLKKK